MWLEILLPALLGGCFAGVLALVVGGVGGMLETRRAVRNLADMVGDLQVQVQREVKRRAGESRQDQARGDKVLDELVRRAQDGSGSTIEGGGYTSAPPKTGADVLALARRRGLVR
ncbi:MAG: hypothetical protein ACRDHF_09275 [Tepidiformaceae bacterium]